MINANDNERKYGRPPHRHIQERVRTKVRAFFSHKATLQGDENTRPGFDNWRSQLDRRRACEETARRASAASQSPPHRHIQERARMKVRAFFRIKPPSITG